MGITQVVTVLVAGLATMLTRFLPFWVFSGGRRTPRVVRYLGHALPGAVFGLLVIYCVKDVSWLGGTHGVPELVGIVIAGGLYLWRRNMLLSIFAATGAYMLMVNVLMA